MPWIKFNGSRMTFLLTLMLLVSSCQKDQVSNNGTVEEPPTVPNPVVKDFSQFKAENPSNLSSYNNININEKEVREVIQMKELLRALIKESLIQLLFNHDFNPLMPQVNTRETCTLCTHTNANPEDCGCPFQDPIIDPDPLNPSAPTYPITMSLKYYKKDAVDCTCILATSPSGLEVVGEMIIEFSAPFTTGGHTIKLYPQDDFTVDGYDIDGTEIEITNPIFGGDTYDITNIDNVSVTKNGDITKAISIDSKSKITITDVGNNHGSIANGFGLLDDIFTLEIIRLRIECDNGAEVVANSTEDLIYNMDCNNIQDGIIELTECNPVTLGVGPDGTPITVCLGGPLVATYDYGAPATGVDPGVCDDIITTTYPTPSN